MGWGFVRIVTKGRKIIVYIQNPPYGLQSERENWGFLIHTILGYMMTINKNLKIEHVSFKFKTLRIVFA